MYEQLEEDVVLPCKPPSSRTLLNQRMRYACRKMNDAVRCIKKKQDHITEFVDNHVVGAMNGSVNMQMERWMSRLAEYYF